MKRILSTIAFLTIICSTLSGSLFTANATSPDRIHYEISGDYEYKLLDDGTAHIMYYLGSSETVEIPETLDVGYAITSFNTDAFDYCEDIISIRIPDNITYINGGGFKNLSEIIVDENNKVYDSRENCNAIIETATNTLIAGCMNTVIPNGITSIAKSAFVGCIYLESITIPESVTDIPHGFQAGFYSCSYLSEINVDENNKVYDSREDCDAIIETATNTLIIGCMDTVIPDSITSISEDAFHGCTKLTSITIPGSVTDIGESAFDFCWHLKSVEIQEGVKNISEDAFACCEELTSITIPSSVTSIGNSAFSCCKSLASVTIMDGVTDIGEGAFEVCSSLTSLTIPRSIKSIGDYAFDSDIKLYVYEDSYAHKYAEDNNFDYEVIASDNEKQSENCSIDEIDNKEIDTPDFDVKKILLCVSIPTILVIVILCVLIPKKKKK